MTTAPIHLLSRGVIVRVQIEAAISVDPVELILLLCPHSCKLRTRRNIHSTNERRWAFVLRSIHSLSSPLPSLLIYIFWYLRFFQLQQHRLLLLLNLVLQHLLLLLLLLLRLLLAIPLRLLLLLMLMLMLMLMLLLVLELLPPLLLLWFVCDQLIGWWRCHQLV